MGKYYVIIDGIRHYADNKRKADALLIDAFLGGVHNIDWNIYKTNKWFVKKQVHEWQFVDELDMFCWVTISDEIVTPMRATEEEANNDFINLGFKTQDRVAVQCHDEIKLNKSWVRHIVQTKTIN